MNTTNITTFITVMQTKSISLAADKLCITQPAVTKRIKSLEDELGVCLFDSVGRGIVPTDSAHELLPFAKRWLGDYQHFRLALQNKDTISGRLVVGTSHHIGLHHLSPILKRFVQMYPNVELNVHFLDSEQAHQAVLNGEVALAFLTLPPIFDKRLDYRLLWSDPLHLVTGAISALAQRSQLSLETLACYPAILPAADTFTTQITLKAFAKHDLKPQLITTTNPLEEIQMLVSVGLGWSVLPETLINQEIIKIDLATPLELMRHLGVVSNPNLTQSPACHALKALLS